MRNTKQDRRSQRTRLLVSQALIELMLEKRYDDITVQDIIDRANIGRSTFYIHFMDKEDVLVSDFSRVLDQFSQHVGEEQLENEVRIQPGIAAFFRHVQEYQQLYKALVRSGQIDLLYKKARQLLRRNFEQHLQQAQPLNHHGQPLLLSMGAEYMASVVMSLLQWWIDNQMPYTPEKMEQLFHQLVMPGLQNVLSVPPSNRSS